MSSPLEIGGAATTIGGNTIDFQTINQKAYQLSFTVPATATADLRTNSMVAVAVAYIPELAPMQNNQQALAAVTSQAADLQMSQLALVLVVSPNSRVISPVNAIKLACWQPCLSYGTQALVAWRK